MINHPQFAHKQASGYGREKGHPFLMLRSRTKARGWGGGAGPVLQQ